MGGSGGGGGSYYSGGGGGGSGGAGGGGGIGGAPGSDPCALTINNVTIHSPNSDYAAGLTLGTELFVRLGGPHNRTLQVYTSQDYLVGSLIGLSLAAQLLACIQQGHVYVATVTNINSGIFIVRIERAAL
jgi:hypothetical protein